MNTNDQVLSAQKIVEKADRILQLMNHPGWKDFTEVLDLLLAQEMAHLAGQPLDHTYFRKIGFLKSTAYVKALDSVLKDKNQREYLMSQGRYKGWETIKNIPHLYQKQRGLALDKLKMMLTGGGKFNPEGQKQFNEDVYKQS